MTSIMIPGLLYKFYIRITKLVARTRAGRGRRLQMVDAALESPLNDETDEH